MVAIAIVTVLTILAGGSPSTAVQRGPGIRGAREVARQEEARSSEQRRQIRSDLGALPLAFERNQGQTDPRAKYIARGNGYTVFLTRRDTRFAFGGAPQSASRDAKSGKRGTAAAIDMRLVGGNQNPVITADKEFPGTVNYYVGSDPRQWRTGVKQYASVTYRNVYPGVDMVFHGAQRQLEFDFVVAPGAPPESIGMQFRGAEKLGPDAQGNLVLTSAGGDVVLHRPVAYQESDRGRNIVDVSFRVTASNEVRLHLGAYDRSRALVIDPSLSYSTYLGGSGEDEAFGIAVDGSGNVYVAGQMASINFPAKTGTVSNVGLFDAFVTKISAAGSSIGFTTVIGGGTDDSALGVAVSGSAVYVVGITTSTAFPSTKTLGPAGGQDAFVASLNTTSGAASYVTRIGGSGTESGNAIAVDSSGNAYIGGETDSTNFPTASALQNSNGGTDDAFVAKLNAAGSALVFSTYLGGSLGDLVTGLALDGSNNVYVTGITVSANFPTTSGAFQTTAKSSNTGFVSEIKADGSALTYSTYLGGSGSENALGIAVDSAGEAYVTGSTTSSDFPTANPIQQNLGGASDVFLTKLNATGTGLVFSTYYGGTLDDAGVGIALDAFGDAYVTGRTSSSNYPTSGAPFQGSLSGTSDAFVTEFSNTGFVEYSSYLGGTGNENSIAGSIAQAPLGAVAVDSSSNAYIAGDTDSTQGFPIVGGIQSLEAGGLADAFVAKVGAAPADFSVAVSPSTISTPAGQTTSTITVTVSSVSASFGQAVALSCAGLPAKAVCNFSNSSVTPGANAVTSDLTIGTSGSSSARMIAPGSKDGTILAVALVPVFGILVLGVRGSGRRKSALGFAMLMFLAALMVLPACGGSGGGGGVNTPPGTYRLNVSGAAGGVTHSAPVTLTVN